MMNSLTSGFNFLLRSVTSPVVTCVRFYERRRVIRRYGYKPHYHSKGLLPRLKDDVMPLKTVPQEKPADPWRKQAALFGQNDYIDILGDDRINPTQLMSSIPHWLRKFRGNEMQMLIRKRCIKSYWKWSRPQKWHELNKRIDFLYKRLNYKKEPRHPEYPSNY